MTDPSEQRARQKLEEGEKKLKKSGGLFSFLSGGSGGITDAVECFVGAANAFKVFFLLKTVQKFKKGCPKLVFRRRHIPASCQTARGPGRLQV